MYLKFLPAIDGTLDFKVLLTVLKYFKFFKIYIINITIRIYYIIKNVLYK